MVEKERQIEIGFKTYVTDSLKYINESVSNVFGGKVMKERFFDIVSPEEEKEETREPEEIIENISKKLDRLAG